MKKAGHLFKNAIRNQESQTAMENDLREVLTQVKAAASNHRERLLKNESATRATLIDPVLRALGWDVANPHKVVVEASARRGQNTMRADYGFFIKGNVEIVIEAKSLGEKLDVHRPQVVDYAYAFNIDNVFLTNGVIWEHYDSTSFNPKSLAPACVLHLKNGNLEQAAEYLESMLVSRYGSEEQGNSFALQIEADELLNKLSVIIIAVPISRVRSVGTTLWRLVVEGRVELS